MARILGMIRWAGAGGEPVTLEGWLYGGPLASWLLPNSPRWPGRRGSWSSGWR
jgi:hypothetical protein